MLILCLIPSNVAAIDGFSLELIVIVLLDLVNLALVIEPMGGNSFPLIWVS